MKLLNLVVTASLRFLPFLLLAEGLRAENIPAPVAIYMSFDGAHSDRAVDAMKQEVEALVKPARFHLQWRALDGSRTEETFSDLMVVKFHGSCNMEGIQLLFSELGPEPEGGTLGLTRTANGHVLPFSELECNQIRRSIAPLSLGYSLDEREALLGRAMGRVLAHELFHIFANTDKHGREGVAKTAYSRKDLLSDGFAFETRDLRRMTGPGRDK
jgi:hypothetical protein